MAQLIIQVTDALSKLLEWCRQLFFFNSYKFFSFTYTYFYYFATTHIESGRWQNFLRKRTYQLEKFLQNTTEWNEHSHAVTITRYYTNIIIVVFHESILWWKHDKTQWTHRFYMQQMLESNNKHHLMSCSPKQMSTFNKF